MLFSSEREKYYNYDRNSSTRDSYRDGHSGGSYQGRGGGYRKFYNSAYHGFGSGYYSRYDERSSYSQGQESSELNNIPVKSFPPRSNSASDVQYQSSTVNIPARAESMGYSYGAYRGTRGSYRGGYRGSYRGGYRGRGGLTSPYTRENRDPYSSSQSQSQSQSQLHSPQQDQSQSRNDSYQSTTQSPGLSKEEKTYASPYIKLLSLDQSAWEKLPLSTEGKTELKKIKEEKEELYKKSQENQKRIKEIKLKNLSLSFQIDILKALGVRDQLNVDSTQEKLDSISFL